MRRLAPEFEKRNAAVVVAGPDTPAAFVRMWEAAKLPFVGVPDPTHSLLRRYGQEVRLFRLGRMPAQVLVDAEGIARWAHYGHSMADIPPPTETLALIDALPAARLPTR